MQWSSLVLPRGGGPLSQKPVQALNLHEAPISPPPPKVDFNLREPSLKEVQEVIKGARSASAPGPSSVPYLVLKRCPELLCQLWKIIGVIWCRWRVANQWRCAEGVWIPKEENSSHIKQLCTISLLSVEGKIFYICAERGGFQEYLAAWSILVLLHNSSEKYGREEEIWLSCGWTLPTPMGPCHTDWSRLH